MTRKSGTQKKTCSVVRDAKDSLQVLASAGSRTVGEKTVAVVTLARVAPRARRALRRVAVRRQTNALPAAIATLAPLELNDQSGNPARRSLLAELVRASRPRLALRGDPARPMLTMLLGAAKSVASLGEPHVERRAERGCFPS